MWVDGRGRMALERSGALVTFEDTRTETRRVLVKFAGGSPKSQGRKSVVVHDVRIRGGSLGGVCDKTRERDLVVGGKATDEAVRFTGKTGQAMPVLDGGGRKKDERTNTM